MLGEKIRELRKTQKITMKQLGTVLGLSESAVGMYENNKRVPDHITLLKIAEYFNVNTNYLLEVGLFQQKDLVIELRAVLTEGLKRLIYEDIAEASKKLSDDEFVNALSQLVDKIDYNRETGEVMIYYYLNPIEQTISANDAPKTLTKSETNVISKQDDDLLSLYKKLNPDNQAYIRVRMKELLKEQLSTEASDELAISKSAG